MNILITGASGLIGTALNRYFSEQGHRVFPLSRGPAGGPFSWQPERGVIHLDDSAQLDVVINLAGPGVADRRWSAQRKQEILQARVAGTELLSRTLAQRQQKPGVFISASAIGFYGPVAEGAVDESSASGTGFLAEVSRQWEGATVAAEAAGIRTVHARFGIVLDAGGGALKRMLLPFRLGLGGVIGSGRQVMSWIAMEDVIAAIDFLIREAALAGPFNLVAPGALTNREFTRALASALHRPAWLPMPAWQARLLFGEMADEILLTGARVLPARLLEAGYQFRKPQLEAALRSIISD